MIAVGQTRIGMWAGHSEVPFLLTMIPNDLSGAKHYSAIGYAYLGLAKSSNFPVLSIATPGANHLVPTGFHSRNRVGYN